MKIRNHPSGARAGKLWPLLLCLGLLLAVSACNLNRDYEDGKFPDPPAIEFRKTATFNGVPAIELQFFQDFEQDENGNLESSFLSVVPRNLTNLEILENSLRYEVAVYDSNLRNAEDIRLKASITLDSVLLPRGIGRKDTFVTNFFDAVLDPDKVEIRLLKYPDGVDYSGAYEGIYRAYRLEPADSPAFVRRRIVHQQPVQLSLAADGLCNAWIAGETPVKSLRGSIAPPDSFFLGNAHRQDGVVAFGLSRCDTCIFQVTAQSLRMEIGVEDSALANGVQIMELDLFPTNKKK